MEKHINNIYIYTEFKNILLKNVYELYIQHLIAK